MEPELKAAAFIGNNPVNLTLKKLLKKFSRDLTQCVILKNRLYIIKCKKHFIKMLKDVGMVVPKIKGTRL